MSQSQIELPPRPRSRRRGRHAGPPPDAGPRPAVPRARGLPAQLPRASTPRLTVAYLLITVLLAIAVAATAGAFEHPWFFLDFGAGVMALVCLSGTVLWGVAATDRMILDPGHRVLAQGVHRGLAVAGLGFLGLHIWVKLAEQRVGARAALVPFASELQTFHLGLGTVAAYLMLIVAASGAVRSAFTGRLRSQLWRGLHYLAYLAWCAGLIHGLQTGRPAKLWASAVYLLSLLGVIVLLAQRIRTRRRPR
ncbi:hypothetical protein [Streptomyces aidingensis]|uniref:DMSO/TMAO reductase YedYZ, heme-binding membrane subunit n=1 Tax=Streptomyces aidingensis TaxID=910347 RepID=A0A1I1JBR3_9ACTN|nr:hypothetical protein [Streptomyces aidingensis]SFC45815.1 hypothetical protein SAMN05421773_103350 [Streptomyces aidingensis]